MKYSIRRENLKRFENFEIIFPFQTGREIAIF